MLWHSRSQRALSRSVSVHFVGSRDDIQSVNVEERYLHILSYALGLQMNFKS